MDLVRRPSLFLNLMGPVETLQAWNQLARIDVNQRAAELGLSHLIRIGPRVINLAPKAALPVVKKGASKRAATWVAATPLAGLVPSAIVGKRLLTRTVIAPVPKGIATSLITAPNALSLVVQLVAGLGVERLAQRLWAPHGVGPRAGTRILSLQDGRCLTKGGMGLGFAHCGAVGADEWRFERTAPRVLLTRQTVLGLVHDRRGARFFAVAEPVDAPSSNTPTVRLCADRWCVRCVSRDADEYVSPAAEDAHAARARISRCSAGSTALVTLLPAAHAPPPPAPPSPPGHDLLTLTLTLTNPITLTLILILTLTLTLTRPR